MSGPVKVALCCINKGLGHIVSSLDVSTETAMILLPAREAVRTVKFNPEDTQRKLGKVQRLRAEHPSVVITSSVDPYSLVALSAKGVEVRLVAEGTGINDALGMYLDGQAKLACNVIGGQRD